jgi:cystathionine beta-synthase
MQDQLTDDDVVVVLFHDHGSRYVGKIFNDDWMRERGFLEEEYKTAGELVAQHSDRPLVTLFAEELVSHAIAKMRKFGISQIPVLKDGLFVGSIDDSHVYQLLVEDPELRDAPISSIMGAPFPVVKAASHLDDLCKLINKITPAVLVEMPAGGYHIVTRYDIISAMS